MNAIVNHLPSVLATWAHFLRPVKAKGTGSACLYTCCMQACEKQCRELFIKGKGFRYQSGKTQHRLHLQTGSSACSSLPATASTSQLLPSLPPKSPSTAVLTRICLEEDLGILEGGFLLLWSRYHVLWKEVWPWATWIQHQRHPSRPATTEQGRRTYVHTYMCALTHTSGRRLPEPSLNYFSRVFLFLQSDTFQPFNENLGIFTELTFRESRRIFPVGTSVLYLARKWHEATLNFFYLLFKIMDLAEHREVKQGDI